jgi:hypothetical protein
MSADSDRPIPATSGVDHIGLSVRDLESTRHFFAIALGGALLANGRITPRHSSRMADRW